MKNKALSAMVLALLIPGGGHFYLGRKQRALVFLVVVVFMFVIGLWLDGRLYVPRSGESLTTLAAFASMGAGSLYAIAHHFAPFGDPVSPTYEYGNAFTLTAGVMNLLLILDAFDIAKGRKE